MDDKTWSKGGVTVNVHEDGALEVIGGTPGHALNLGWATELTVFLAGHYLPGGGAPVPTEPVVDLTPVLAVVPTQSGVETVNTSTGPKVVPTTAEPAAA